MPKSQILKPIGPGSVPDPYLTTPDRGFFHYASDGDNTQDDIPFWRTVINEATISNNVVYGGHSSWAVTDTSVQISVALESLNAKSCDKILSIRSCAQISSGINQTNGSSVTPSGNGNNFNLGIRTGNPRQNFIQQFWAGSSDYTIFTAIFTEKSAGVPFEPVDLINIEWYLQYGYYWTTTDKNLTINDNAHNDIGQAWVEVNYEKGGSPPATFFLFL